MAVPVHLQLLILLDQTQRKKITNHVCGICIQPVQKGKDTQSVSLLVEVVKRRDTPYLPPNDVFGLFRRNTKGKFLVVIRSIYKEGRQVISMPLTLQQAPKLNTTYDSNIIIRNELGHNLEIT